MDSVFVPSGNAAAVLSQLSASRLDLRLSEGLNGCPEEFYRALFLADALGLADNPAVVSRLRLLESHGVAVAMSGASSLDRMASVLENDNLRWSRPEKGYAAIPDDNRPEGATGERMPPKRPGRVSEGDR